MSVDNAQMNTLDILDAQLDDMKDLPAFTTFPAGVYVVKPSVTQKKDAKTGETHITVGAKLLEIKEVNDKDAKLPEIGDETSCRYTWENEWGQGGLKNLIKPIAVRTGVGKVSELLELLGTADSVVLVMDTRDGETKNGKTPVYQKFVDLILE